MEDFPTESASPNRIINTGLEELNNLVSAHYKRIDMSDGIYVVNIDGYIGKSVSAEINYAKKAGKEILYHCE